MKSKKEWLLNTAISLYDAGLYASDREEIEEILKRLYSCTDNEIEEIIALVSTLEN